MAVQRTILLCGDVMTGRGVDQILDSPGDPRLWESVVDDARDYVRLAEIVHGPIHRPVSPSWIWGDALADFDRIAPDARVINLETSITGRGSPDLAKPVLYRMNPANIACLTAVRPDVCVLANNHILDFGREGLADTLAALRGAGLANVGAGPSEAQAWQPAMTAPSAGQLMVFAAGTPSSGVPPAWAAHDNLSGVAYLRDLSDAAADSLIDRIERVRRPGAIVVVSIHWGSNWGYDAPREQVRFAHRLVGAGVDLVHGHSSHHPRRFEVYRDRLILYGCGDFVDDYEGIGGYEDFRDDLRPAYFASLDAEGRLESLRIVVYRSRRLRLERAAPADVADLARMFADIGSPVRLHTDGSLTAAAAA
ncbi:CapA family protein [Hamadaea sp. NPDC051192]|uniref:CapA family protein n=1 Tax=Hamadaea sp. NPDC051192 TaxID=3154940 RepID=UPI0034269E3C